MRAKYADFLRSFARITKVFGDKTYPMERIQIIWRELSDLTQEAVDSVIVELIADPPQGRAPMREAFRNAAQSHRTGRSASFYDHLPTCSWCGRTGTVVARRLVDGQPYDYAFRCPFCPAAEEKRVSSKIPLWGRELVPEYWPRYASGEYVDIDDVDTAQVIPMRAITIVEAPPIPLSELIAMSARQMPIPGIRPVPDDTPAPI